MRCDVWAGMMSWWSCQSPVSHSGSLLNHPNSSHGAMFKLNAKFDADSFLYLSSHLEWNDHTVYVLTQWHLPPRLTRIVKLSLFTCAHSSSLSLAAKLNQCHTNHSHYINNGWTFSGQTIYIISILLVLFPWRTLTNTTGFLETLHWSPCCYSYSPQSILYTASRVIFFLHKSDYITSQHKPSMYYDWNYIMITIKVKVFKFLLNSTCVASPSLSPSTLFLLPCCPATLDYSGP